MGQVHAAVIEDIRRRVVKGSEGIVQPPALSDFQSYAFDELPQTVVGDVEAATSKLKLRGARCTSGEKYKVDGTEAHISPSHHPLNLA